MNDYITMMISSDQFDDKPNHNVEVLADVPIKTIIYEIQKEFRAKGRVCALDAQRQAGTGRQPDSARS
ncbi:MAG: hypothetical protein HND48_12465 [Chloroflexi bacterium]|nr:hypothetical protein [Chloroflexota bacterium]